MNGLLLRLQGPTQSPRPSSSRSRSVRFRFYAARVVALGFAIVAAAAADTDGAAAFAATIARDPVGFAAGALEVLPPGDLTVAPGAWPPLVPDCTAAFLNASVASAAQSTTVVRVEVPEGRAVSLRECRTRHSGEAAPMWHVRLVLAMGRSSAVALEAWDVAVGGVTIEGPAGNASSIVDALVVVGGGSRIVAGTSSAAARSASIDPAEDVHALSVVAPVPGAAVSVSGLGLVVAEGSVVRATHYGVGVLYASACGVRAEATQDLAAVAGGRASLTLDRLRVVVTGGSSVEASTSHSVSEYQNRKARRAHAATIQVMTGARVTAARVVVAVVDGSTISAAGDDSSSAAGGIGVNGRLRGSSGFIATTVAVSHATLIAAGPNTTVRVTTRGDGNGASLMGIAASGNGADVSMANVAIDAVGPNTTIAMHVTGYGGGGASAMGVAAAQNGATASMTNSTVSAVGPDTTVAAHVFSSQAARGRGRGVTAMGVAAYHYGVASMTNVALRAGGPNTNVVVDIEGYGGYGASAMGVAACETRATASMMGTTIRAAGSNTTVAVRVTGGSGLGASAMGVAASTDGAKASMTNAAVYAVGPSTTVAVRTTSYSGGASTIGAAAYDGGAAMMTNVTLVAVGPNTTVTLHTPRYGGGASVMGIAACFKSSASMSNATVYAVGPNTTVAVHVTGGGGSGATAMGVAATAKAATASMTNTAVYAVGPDTTVAVHVWGGRAEGASAMGIGLGTAGRFAALGTNIIARCSNVSITSKGANDIVVFDEVLDPRVTFDTLSSCPKAPELPDRPAARWPTGGGRSAGRRGAETATGTASRSAPSASRSASRPAVFITTATETVLPAGPLDDAAVSPSTSTTNMATHRQPTDSATAASVTETATHSAARHPGDELVGPAAAGVPFVAPTPVPAAASASASVLAGVLLPSSASKPMANARALQVADVCLSAVGADEALNEVEPGEWPSDYAVVIARWEVGGGGEGSAARARAAGAAVGVACAAVATTAAVVRFATSSSSASGPHDGLPSSAARPRPQRTAAASLASTLAITFTVGAAYLIPNALEAAVVAATAGLGGTTRTAGAAAGCVMVAAVVPVFAVTIHAPPCASIHDENGHPPSPQPPLPASASAAGLLGTVAGFLHPVLVDGLRDEASPLLRAHALMDFAVACGIAAAAGAMYGGVRIGGSCVLLVLIMAVASAGLTVYYALVRPFAARLEVAVATAQSGTLAVLCGMTLVAVASGGAAVSGDALEAAGLAADAVSFGAPLVLLAPVVWRWLRGGRDRAKNAAPAAAAATGVSAVTVGGQGGDASVGTAVDVPLLTLPEHRDGQPALMRSAVNAAEARNADHDDDDVGAPGRVVRRNPLMSPKQ